VNWCRASVWADPYVISEAQAVWASPKKRYINGDVMSENELQAELDRLRKENEALKKGAAKGVSLKVSEKGGLSVYGLGRFPITLYQEQWTRLLDMATDIREFIDAHKGELKKKG
jgi:hypothetical protein